MFFNELVSMLKGPDYAIWYSATANLNSDKWTFQKFSNSNVPEMDKWVEKVGKDTSLNCYLLKAKCVADTVPYKTPSTYSKSDCEKIFYAAVKSDENKVRLVVRKTKAEIKKWIRKYAADEKKEASVARYIQKM